MSLLLGVAGGCLALLVGYIVLALALGHEGRTLVDRFVRAPRTTVNGDEERIYLRRSPRRRRQTPAYEVPPELDFQAGRGDGQLAAPPAAWDGRNPDT